MCIIHHKYLEVSALHCVCRYVNILTNRCGPGVPRPSRHSRKQHSHTLSRHPCTSNRCVTPFSRWRRSVVAAGVFVFVVEASKHVACSSPRIVDERSLRHPSEAARLRAARPPRERRVPCIWLAASALSHRCGQATTQVRPFFFSCLTSSKLNNNPPDRYASNSLKCFH